MAVESLSTEEISAALRQIVSAPAFRQNNPGLSPAEISAILNGVWPSSPVFTPYAHTHHGYSQKYTDYHCIYSHTDHCKTVRFKGIKYLTHRITYQSCYHDILPASSRNEISHTLYLGSITSREVYQILKGWSFSMLTVETETLILCILSKRTIFLIKRARHALYFLVHGLGAPFLLMD